jgi:hypothetical protein
MQTYRRHNGSVGTTATATAADVSDGPQRSAIFWNTLSYVSERFEIWSRHRLVTKPRNNTLRFDKRLAAAGALSQLPALRLKNESAMPQESAQMLVRQFAGRLEEDIAPATASPWYRALTWV